MFSVVLPVYNGEKWLGEAIESVLSQTFKDLELLVVCNGCDDSSEQVAYYHKVQHQNYLEQLLRAEQDTLGSLALYHDLFDR